jgi:hypothetical protein
MTPKLVSRFSSKLRNNDVACLTVDEIHAVAFSTLGLYIVVNSFPQVVQEIGTWYTFTYGVSANKPKFMSVISTLYLVSIMAKMALGIWLLIGSRGIAKFIRKTRDGNGKATTVPRP